MSISTVLITGCSTGLGRSIALSAAATGLYNVWATMRDTSKGTAIADAAREQGCSERLHVLQLDVCDDASVAAAVEHILGVDGKIDVLINNAGYSVFGGVEMLSMDDMKAQFETNFFGCIRTIRAVSPAMRAARKGLIINVSSVGGIWGQPFNDIYCASKFALEGMIESMASVYALLGIKLVLLEPGGIRTEFVHNAKFPGNVPADLLDPMQKVLDYYQRMLVEAGTAQDPNDIALTVLDVMSQENPPLRVQTNTAIQSIFEAKLADTTGNSQTQLATRVFFS